MSERVTKRAGRMAGLTTLAPLAVFAALLAPRATLACAVCFGDPDSPQTKAMGAGILFMLGCIGTVLACFAAVFCYWAVRSHRLAMANEGATN